jgi:hypothetical protein
MGSHLSICVATTIFDNTIIEQAIKAHETLTIRMHLGWLPHDTMYKQTNRPWDLH